MTDFNIGARAPDFSLPHFTLSNATKKGDLLLTFYKKSCPTCQFSYPFFQDLHIYYGGPTFKVVGIGQDLETKEFSQKQGVTFLMVSDTPTYDVSRQYHLKHVPSVFLISKTGIIEFISVGFYKKEFQQLSEMIGQKTHKPVLDLFLNKSVPDFKPG